jgi:hypothetical protein
MALTKQERQELFVQQRTAELTAAGKPVDTAALTARFNELAATPEGRKQITSKVQLANAPQAAADAAANQEAFNSLYNYRNSLLSPQPVVRGSATSSEGATVLDTYFEGSGSSRMRVTEFDNGYIKRVSVPEEDGEDAVAKYMKKQNALEFQQGVETASSILASTLKYYGMDEPALLQDVKTALADRRITGASTIDDIGIQLRESEAFRRRFGANEARRAANKPAYSVSQYLQLESSYRQVLNAAGMPKDFYTDRTDIESFITNDISPDEVQYRVQQGYAAVKNADPAVVNELKTLYGLDEGTLAAYFIDPTKTKDAVVRSARAAEVAAQARKQADIGLTRTQAEELVLGGVTEQQAQQAFSDVRSLQELTRPTAGEQALTQEDLIQGVTGVNAAAQQRVAKTARRRQATLQGGGQVGLGTVGE